MTKNSFVHILADAMQQHEGWSAITGAAYPNLNPGNLKFANQPAAVQEPSGFARFPTFFDGKQAQLNQLNLDLTRFDTISDLVNHYAPASDNNNTAAYIDAIVQFLNARNIPITATSSISSLITLFAKPTIIVAINQIWEPVDWAAIQEVIAQAAKYMPEYSFSCRYSNADLLGSVVEIATIISPTTSMISQEATANVLTPYNEGDALNVMIYSGSVMQGKPAPAGGCEYQGAQLSPISAISSVMYNGPAFTDACACVLFHELIHELFKLTQQTDTLHDYLITHGGYQSDLAVDLEAVFTGNQLNTPAALSNLKKQENNL